MFYIITGGTLIVALLCGLWLTLHVNKRIERDGS